MTTSEKFNGTGRIRLPGRRQIQGLGTALAISLVLISCSKPENEVQNDAQYEARKELAALNKDYSQAEFFNTASNGDLTAIKLYVSAGMDVNTSDMRGNTALAVAVVQDQSSVVRFLLAHGANPEAEAPDETGLSPDLKLTPLMLAAMRGSTESAKALLEGSADANAVSEKGWTPLMYAAWEEYLVQQQRAAKKLEVAKLLLPKVKQIEVENSDGRTAFDLAEKSGDWVMLETLVKGDTNALTHELVDTLQKRIEDAVKKGSETKDAQAVKASVFDGLADLEKTMLPPDQMKLAREKARLAVSHEMQAIMLGRSYGSQTSADRELAAWFDVLLAEIDAKLKLADSNSTTANLPP